MYTRHREEKVARKEQGLLLGLLRAGTPLLSCSYLFLLDFSRKYILNRSSFRKMAPIDLLTFLEKNHNAFLLSLVLPFHD